MLLIKLQMVCLSDAFHFFFHFIPIYGLPVSANQVNENKCTKNQWQWLLWTIQFIVKCLDKESQFFFQPVAYNNYMLRHTAHALQWSLHKCFVHWWLLRNQPCRTGWLDQTVTFSSLKLVCHCEVTVKLLNWHVRHSEVLLPHSCCQLYNNNYGQLSILWY